MIGCLGNRDGQVAMRIEDDEMDGRRDGEELKGR